MEAGEGLNAALDRIRRVPSPRIARQLAAAGLAASELSIEQLSSLPAIGPRDLDLSRLDDPVADALLADAPRPVRLGTCERAGATIVLPFTAADLARVAAYGARALAGAGVRAGAIVANTLEGGLETPGSLVLGDALERLGAVDVPLGPVPDEKTAKTIAAMIARVGAEVLVLDSASAPLVAALAERRPQPTITLGAEWIALPEASVFFAVRCVEGSLHLDPDAVTEIRSGMLRVSAVVGDTPLLAYEPGLRADALGAGCRCGDARLTIVI